MIDKLNTKSVQLYGASFSEKDSHTKSE
jgi:hypothetical protein